MSKETKFHLLAWLSVALAALSCGLLVAGIYHRHFTHEHYASATCFFYSMGAKLLSDRLWWLI